MKRMLLVALATAVVGCAGGENFTGPVNPPIGKPDTPVSHVPDPVSFSRSQFKLDPDEKLDLLGKYGTNPSNATLAWNSTDSSVATVENGVITGRSFGTATVSVTPSGGTTTSVKIWVGRPSTSFAAATQGCPTQAEVDFVSTAIPYANFEDSSTETCSGSGVAMTKVKAAWYRGVANLASLHMDSMSWAPGSRNLFEWFAFDSKLAGVHFVNGIKAGGECCETVNGVWGVIIINVDALDKAFDTRAIISFMATAMHEAHHIRFGGHKCFASNGLVLDNNLQENGPFAINYLFANWLSTSNTLTPTEQTREKEYATNVGKSMFCSPVS